MQFAAGPTEWFSIDGEARHVKAQNKALRKEGSTVGAAALAGNKLPLVMSRSVASLTQMMAFVPMGRPGFSRRNDTLGPVRADIIVRLSAQSCFLACASQLRAMALGAGYRFAVAS